MTQGFPLSPQQEHLFRLAAEDGAPPYRSLAVVAVDGELDPELLRAAAADLVARHEVLRTVFEQPRGLEVPIQVVRDAGDLPPAWSAVDLTGAGDEGRARRLAALLEDARRSPGETAEVGTSGAGASGADTSGAGAFGLRLALARIAPERHRLVLSVPALCADGAGVGQLAAELERAYRARLGGNVLDGEPMQAADLAAWQRDLLEAEGAEVGLDHWRRRDLTGLLHFRLPFEARADAASPFRPRSLEHALGDEVRAGVAALAAGVVAPGASGGGVTASDVLLAAWAALLGRLTEQERLVIGVLGDGRQYEGLEEAVAPMARSLPLTVEPAAETRFNDFLLRVAEARAEAEEWQEYFTWDPWRNALRHLRGSLFFPVLFESRAPVAPVDGGWRIERRESLGDRFRLRLTVRESRDGGLSLGIDYDAAVVDRASVALLAERLETLLGSAVARPDAAIDELEVLGRSERRVLFADPGAEAEDEGAGEDAAGDPLDGFRRWVADDPGRPAVSGAGERLSYGDLAADARRAARRLRQLGVGTEVRVGLAAGRSPRTAAALLGVLEAGGAFVPLDPTYPAERLRFMLDDAGISVLLAERGVFEPPADHGAEVVWLDQLLAADDGPPPGAEEGVTVPPAALAYVIYTSGSTGEPRGAMITRGNLAGYLGALGRRLGIEPSDRYLHTASISFSSSVRQLFLPLSRGAEVVIAGDDERRDPLALLALAGGSGVTVLDLVPSHWRACVHALGGLEERRRLLGDGAPRLIVSASEPLASDLPQAWRHRLGHPARMVNMFGQTETTGIVASHRIEPPAAGAVVMGVPVGRALDGTRLEVLDRRLRPAPLGVPGRVHVAGGGVGRGYLGRPAASAERLLPDPLSRIPGGRLYDTGDVGRRRPDGVVELLGRADHQVKLRGLRVELGEIEATLTGHPSVRQGVVAIQPGAGAEPRLVAYVVPVEPPGPSADGLRTYLQERLPDYMVPAFYVALDELPLAATGKVDRRALPAATGTGGAAAEYVAPRDPIEERLAEIWSRLLGVERVGIHDNFFRLGGHSLLGTVLMTRLRDAFAVDLPVVRLFEAPTVAGLAAVIAPLAGGDGEVAERIPRVSRDEEAPAVDALSDAQVDSLLGELLAGEEGGDGGAGAG